MNTRLYRISDPEAQKNEIEEIAAFIKSGEAVAIPTETVYGIAADCFNEKAVEKIYLAKGRPSDNPLIVHISRFEEIYSLVEDVPEKAISMTVKQILRCEHIISAVPYKVKAQAIYDTVNNDVTNMIPATILKTHHDAQLFIDNDSASLLTSGVPENI